MALLPSKVRNKRGGRVGPKNYLGNPKLKAANVKIDFTQDQVIEYARCASDPIYFIKNYVKIVNVDKGLIPFEMWPFQEKMVETFNNNRFSICKLPRQVGKSTTVCAYFMWCILFIPSQNFAILANKGSLARDLLEKIRMAYEYLPLWLQQGVLVWNKGNIELENGSKIMAAATSSSAIRGGSFNAILLDEFAFVQRNMQESFFSSVYPTISSGKTTKVIIVSTPNGLGNMFYKLWMDAVDGRNGYQSISVHWSDIPGRDEAWRQQTIDNTSLRQFQQEFECSFLGSTDTLIDPNIIRNMVYINPIYSKEGLDLIERPIQDRVYSIVCDTSRGIGKDYSAFVVVDITATPYKIVAKYRHNEISPLLYPNVIYETGKAYNNAFVLIEINDNGQQVADLLQQDLEYDNVVFTSIDKRGQWIGNGFGKSGVSSQRGVKTSKTVKRLGCTLLKNLVENHKLIITDIDCIGELSTFILNKDTYQAEDGSNDDLAMCLVLFAWMINQDYFKAMVNANIRGDLYSAQMKQIEEEITPFGIIVTGVPEETNSMRAGIGDDWWLVRENDDSMELAKS